MNAHLCRDHYILVLVLASPARPQIPLLVKLITLPMYWGLIPHRGISITAGRPLVCSVAHINPWPPPTSISWGSRAEGANTQ